MILFYFILVINFSFDKQELDFFVDGTGFFFGGGVTIFSFHFSPDQIIVFAFNQFASPSLTSIFFFIILKHLLNTYLSFLSSCIFIFIPPQSSF